MADQEDDKTDLPADPDRKIMVPRPDHLAGLRSSLPSSVDFTWEMANSARDVALSLRAWAAENNLLKRGGAVQHIGVTDEWAAQAMSAEAATILERQAITAFGVNPLRNKVIVYTNRKITKRQASILPQNFGQVQIEYQQARPVTIENPDEESVLGVLPYSVVMNKYTCGSSVGVGNTRSAGTLGCLVRDANGTLFGLTNNHVTGGCNNTREGMPIVAPGILDVMVGGTDPFTIGWHHSVLPMRQGEPTAISHFENTRSSPVLAG